MYQIYTRFTNSGDKYNKLMGEVSSYMKHNELSPELKNRVFRYIKFMFQKHIFKESDIKQTLSSTLKNEILLYTCQDLVEKVEFFKNLPHQVILSIVSRLKPVIYLANDVIVEAGTPGKSMFFVHRGSVAVYTATNKEVKMPITL